VKKTILVYGILGGLLIALLKIVEYRVLVLEHSLEIYGGIVALIFSGLGIWLGPDRGAGVSWRPEPPPERRRLYGVSRAVGNVASAYAKRSR
jgi:hypothetical protein